MHSPSIEATHVPLLCRRAAASIAAAALWLAGAAVPAWSQGAPAVPELVKLAPGVYVAPGSAGSASRENGGHIANTGVLIGPSGVVIIDPGPTAAFGERLRAAIAQLTAQPVVLLVNTHPQAEIALANSAFAGVPAQAHPAAAAFMRERCSGCLASLREKLGDAALAGTAIVNPTGVAARPHTVVAGGRRLRLLPFGPAASIGDLAVLDEESGTLFAGALAAGHAVPDVRDADLDGWTRALAELWREPHRRIVPGRGALDSDPLAETAAYLNALDRLATREVAAGADLASVDAPLPAFSDRPGYAEHHAANLRRAFVRAEARWLLRP